VALEFSAPFIATGYGTQTAVWVPRLASLGHQVAVSGPFSFAGSTMMWKDFTIYPGAGEAFGMDIIQGHYSHWHADLLITLADVFMMDPGRLKPMNTACWTPVDCKPLGLADARILRAADCGIIAMSKFGKEQLDESGFHARYIPHAIETDIFCPVEADERQELRGQMGIPEGTFVIGMNVSNKEGPRKAVNEQVTAFARFHRRHPQSLLMLHTAIDGGNKLQPLIENLGIIPNVMVADQYSYKCGMMDQRQMVNWYRACDIVSNASYGEGFGLTGLEAQACGTPVVLADNSTGPELCGAGWLADCQDFWVQGHQGWWGQPYTADIERCYEEAWVIFSEDFMEPLRRDARQFALQYDADKVLDEYWKPVLELLEAGFPRVRTMRTQDLIPVELPEKTNRDIAVLVPTRGRPDNVKRLIDAVAATRNMSTDLWFAMDDDDETLEECLAICKDKSRVNVVFGPRKSMAAWTNHLALEVAGHYQLLVSMGDDHLPLSDGWDAALLKAAGTCGMAYPNDKVREDVCEVVAISSQIVQELGWMCMPGLDHYYVDNVWYDLGSRAQCLTYLPEVIVEHVHHLRSDGVERDSTYRRAESSFPADQATYESWTSAQRNADVETVKKVIAGCRQPQPA
jgi:glycosyltransferase involved in cell wall biosynthesis